MDITFTNGRISCPSLTWLSVNSWTSTHYATSYKSPPPILNQSPVSFSLQNFEVPFFFFFNSLSDSKMEGLIPFVYKAIVQYKNEKQVPAIRSWLSDSPSASYIRLPSGDSGRFQFQSDGSYSATSPPGATQILVSTGVQSPIRHLTSRRVAA